MKINPVDSPDVTDASCKEATQRTLKQWFAELDQFGGLEQGRRELVNHVHEATAKNAWWATTIAVEYERAKGQKEKDGKPTGYSICSTKTIAAPLTQVFAAFAEAQQMDRWLGAKTRVDFKDGGSFANGDGDQGTYKRIRTDKDLRFSWDHPKLAAGSAVEVMFADKGKGKTGITLNHTRIQSRREADEVRDGWGNALETLKIVLEKA